MDLIALPLPDAEKILAERGCSYQVAISHPSQKKAVLEDFLYVVRQQIHADGTYYLIAARKMGKEVL